ncbi:MAG: hypothetical protein R3B09_32050 [Nannocystaceae bacterium]
MCGCNPKTDASVTGSAGTDASTSTTEDTACDTSGQSPAADPCEVHLDAKTCAANSCAWFEIGRFPGCNGRCDLAEVAGLCITLVAAPQTGCTGPCAKFWRRTADGVELLEGDFCFEFPLHWSECWWEDRLECACGCADGR